MPIFKRKLKLNHLKSNKSLYILFEGFIGDKKFTLSYAILQLRSKKFYQQIRRHQEILIIHTPSLKVQSRDEDAKLIVLHQMLGDAKQSIKNRESLV